MGFNELINPVAETVRNAMPSFLGGQQDENSNPSTPWYQPDKITQDGKTFKTNNKTFNEDTPEQLKQLVSSSMSKPAKAGDRHFYVLEDEYGQQKVGTSKGSVYDRYSGDPAFQNFKVVMDRQVSNANEIERRFQGNKGFLDARSFDFGTSSQGPLQSGNTEVYEVAKSPMVMSQLLDAVNELDDEQLQASRAMMNFADKQYQKNVKISTDKKAQQANYSLLDSNTYKLAFEQLMSEDMGSIGTGLKDTALGSALAIDKFAGGFADLVGADSVKKHFRDRANINYEAITNKEGAGQAIGELLPEIALPAGIVAKGVSKGAKIATGAITGGATNAGIEYVKSKSDIKLGDDQHILMAGGLGAVIGGFVGGLTKNKQLGEAIGKTFEDGSPEVRQAILDKYPEAQGSLQKYVDEKQAVKPQEEVVQETVVTPKKESITIEKEVVKGESKPTNVKSGEAQMKKGGKKQKSEALIEQEKMARTSESKIVDPKEKTGKELPNQKAIREKDESFVQELGWDFRARNYDERGQAVSAQGGTEAKFSQAIQDRKPIKSVDDEVERLTKMYDNDSLLRESYNAHQATLKGAVKKRGKAQQKADKLQFQRDNYLELSNNKKLTKEQRDLAKKRADSIQKQKIVQYKTPKHVKQRVKETYEKQFEGKVFSPQKTVETRERKILAEENKMSDNYKAERQSKADELELDESNTIRDVAREELEKLKPAYIKAVESVEDLANAKGLKYDAETTRGSEFSTHQKVIDEYTRLKVDNELYNQGDIHLLQLQDRMKARLDEKIFENSKVKLQDETAFKEFVEADNLIRDRLSLPRRDIKPPKKTKISEPSVSRTDTSKEEAIRNHAIRMSDISKGKATLDNLEKTLLDAYMNISKIAELSAPIAKKSDQMTRRAEVREELITELNNKTRGTMGLPRVEAETPKDRIVPSDSTADFSNSVGQNTALIMGDLKLAENVKLTGKSDDFRTKIADRINQELGTYYTKSDIKPLFMQQMYGQMEKGLVKTVKGDKILFDGYEKAMKEDYPAFYELSDNLMDLAKQNPTGEFKYKLPDGVEIEFKLQGKDTTKADGQIIEVGTGKYDNFSRAFVPNIMHSVDGYVIREIQRRLFDSGLDSRAIHDALTFRNEHSDTVFRTALDVQKDMLQSNILHDIMTQLGYKGEPLKKNTLTTEHLESSLGKSMDYEHIAKQYEDVTSRALDNSRILSKEDIIREFFARDNVKLSGTNSLLDHMVTESGFNTLKYSKARTTDDIYERAMVEALTGRTQDRIKVKKEFESVQEDIFREARAKAEKNPHLRGYLEGKRKYFDESGTSLLSNHKNIKQIEVEEMRLYRKQIKALNRQDLKAINKVARKTQNISKLNGEQIKIPDYNQLSKQIKSWKPSRLLTTNDMKAIDIINKVEIGEKSRLDGLKNLFDETLSTKPEWKEFNALETMRNVFKSESSRKGEIVAEKVSKISKGKQEDIKNLLNSDYEAIRGMTKEQADKIWKDSKSLRDIIYKEINAGAKALKSNSEQIGAYLNNPTLILERYNLDKSHHQLVDQLISIKAMKDNSGWETLSKLGDDSEMNYVLDLVSTNRKTSEDLLFSNNPEKIIKGYRPEVYTGNKKLENGRVRYDADDKFESGIIGSEKENKKIGTLFEEEVPKFKSPDEEIRFMFENRLKKTNGQYRKVANDKTRQELGQSDDLSQIMGEMVRSTSEKLKSVGLTSKMLQDLHSDKSLLFSKEAKDGFVPLTKEQQALIPYDLREDMRFINPNFIDKLIGRKEIRLFANTESSQAVKIADRLLNNFGTMFKQNVVLKNPASYMNAMLVNQTLGMAQKANPVKYAKYQKDAMVDILEMNKLLEKVTQLKATGKKIPKALSTKLESNLLYQMERKGLSTNKVEGVLGDGDLLGSITEDKLGQTVNTFFRYFNLNQKTVGGKASLKAFTAIDTIGRYAMTKHLHLDKNIPIEEAVREANNLFGNMDKMVSPLIEKLDKYGIVPFAKWFSLTSPQLLKLSKDNPVTALVLGITLYMIGQESDRNLSSVNPIEAMIDFSEDSLYLGTKEKLEEQGFLDTVQNRVSSNVIPKYMQNAYRNPETMGLHKLAKERIHYGPFKGFTQQTVESFQGEK